jgi:Ran GTPase-activating protein (RanGAP) involved in mRNA processing and transport
MENNVKKVEIQGNTITFESEEIANAIREGKLDLTSDECAEAMQIGCNCSVGL